MNDSGELTTKDDIEIEPIASEEDDYESSPAEYEISTYPADFTLEVLYGKWKAGDITIPKFQRQFVWKQAQASKLIESFLVGLPVPAIFLYTERKSQKFLVIDGQQRLKSLCYFFEGYFGDETKGKRAIFRMKGLSESSRWYNKSFADFDESDQRKLKNCILRAFVVQQLDPNDDTSIYHIFERLNTGGTLLKNQEVRNCVYGGSFNETLIELNTYSNWRSILGKPKPDSRQKDVELILRFFALFNNADKYDKPMKDFLSKFMRKYRHPDEAFIKKHTEIFKRTCDCIVKNLGEKPFHVRAGLNVAVFDSVVTVFAKHCNSMPQNIKNRYEQLVGIDEFKKLISGATTDVNVVRKRLELAEKALFGD